MVQAKINMPITSARTGSIGTLMIGTFMGGLQAAGLQSVAESEHGLNDRDLKLLAWCASYRTER